MVGRTASLRGRWRGVLSATRGWSGKAPLLERISWAWLAIVIVVAIGAEAISPWDPQQIDLRNRLSPPVFFGGAWQHPLGTDEIGRDVFSRLVFSIRISLLVALVGVCVATILGTFLGFLAAHFGGWLDDALMVLVDIQATIPFFVLALGLIAILGTDLLVFLFVVGIYGWERFARLARAMALSAKERGWAQAVRGLGGSSWRLYWRHILPNVLGVIVVNATLNFPETVLLESGLSFLGLGVQPPMTSLGSMMGDGRNHLTGAWWIATFPGLAIFLTTLAVSIVGDRLQDRVNNPPHP